MIDWRIWVSLISTEIGSKVANGRHLGKRIVELQTSIALINAPKGPQESFGLDSFGRLPYEHPALGGLSNLSSSMKYRTLDRRRLYQLGDFYGITRVTRWKPRKVCSTNMMVLDDVSNFDRRTIFSFPGLRLSWRNRYMQSWVPLLWNEVARLPTR